MNGVFSHSSQPTTCLPEETKLWACFWPVTIFVILPQGSSVTKHFTYRKKNGMFFYSELSPRKPKFLIGQTDSTFNFSHFLQTNQSLIYLKPQRTKSSQKGSGKKIKSLNYVTFLPVSYIVSVSLDSTCFYKHAHLKPS